MIPLLTLLARLAPRSQRRVRSCSTCGVLDRLFAWCSILILLPVGLASRACCSCCCSYSFCCCACSSSRPSSSFSSPALSNAVVSLLVVVSFSVLGLLGDWERKEGRIQRGRRRVLAFASRVCLQGLAMAPSTPPVPRVVEQGKVSDWSYRERCENGGHRKGARSVWWVEVSAMTVWCGLVGNDGVAMMMR